MNPQTMQLEHVLPAHNDLGEGPLWHPGEDALYWVDIHGKKIQRYHPESKDYQIFPMPMKVTALALREGGGFIIASDTGLHFWDPATGEISFIAHPEAGKAGARFNDGKADRAGRFWAGTMEPTSATSALYRLDADGSLHTVETGITISNGIGWSPDNSTMYYVDSLRYTIYAYDFDLACGVIRNRRDLARFEPAFGIPDGLTVDSQGHLWVAFYDGWKVARINPTGNITAIIDFPVARVTSCAFGGRNLDELYVTTAIDSLPEHERQAQPLAGDLFRVKPGVTGIPEPSFIG